MSRNSIVRNGHGVLSFCNLAGESISSVFFGYFAKGELFLIFKNKTHLDSLYSVERLSIDDVFCEEDLCYVEKFENLEHKLFVSKDVSVLIHGKSKRLGVLRYEVSEKRYVFIPWSQHVTLWEQYGETNLNLDSSFYGFRIDEE